MIKNHLSYMNLTASKKDEGVVIGRDYAQVTGRPMGSGEAASSSTLTPNRGGPQ